MISTVTRISQHYVDLYPAEAADVLQALEDDQLVAEITDLTLDALSDVIDFLSPIRAQYLFSKLNIETKLQLLLNASPRLVLKLLVTLPETERNELLDQLSRSTKKELEKILSFPPDSVASLMSSTTGTIFVDMSVTEAIEQIRVEAKENHLTQLVVDRNNRLLGRVTTHDLALSHGDKPIRDILQEVLHVVHITDSHSTVVEMLETTDVDVLPVLDEENKVLGIVKTSTLRNVVQEDTQADLQRMVGVSTEERALSSGLSSIKHRLPWLYINLFTAFLAAAVVGMFESLVAQVTALAVLLPVVAGQSGNAGSQAMAVAIRGLALREISFRQWFRLAKKELLVGTINGFLIAIVCGFAVFMWQQSIGLSIIIALSMILALAIAGIAGALVPILLARFGQDPATASSIILTTVTDVVGFFVFLGIAALLVTYI